MLFGNRGPRSSAARRRGEFQPRIQPLEERFLLAIDLGGVAPPGQPNIATTPFGVDLAAAQTSGAAGFSVNDVGDVNNDGFDDFVIGAPTGVNIGNSIQPGTGSNSRAYLIFGSATLTASNALTPFDWLNLDKAGQRVGDLSQLGNVAQTNPISGTATTAPFAGITFLNTQNTAAQLGSSVGRLGDINNDGFDDFLIGAPGATDSTGANANAGRVYLVYGGAFSNITANTVDLDNPGATAGVSVITFVTTILNSRLGRSVAGVGSVLNTGSTASDIALGAPNASLAGQTDNGAVYLLPGTSFATASNTTVNVVVAGQGAGAVTFAGSTFGQEIGQSVAGAGNVNGDVTTLSRNIDDLLIGAPNANGLAGAAYLVYGSSTLPGQSTNVSGTSVITIDRIGGTGATGVAGATFQGAAGWRTGFAVSSIGDYNGDGFADIAIGSPQFQNATGRVDIFYGQPAAGTTLVGTIPLNNPPAGVPGVSLIGALQGNLTGYSLSLSGKVNAGELGNDFLVGSPGFNSSQGAVYFFPANPFFITGTFQLTAAESQPLAGTLITITNTAAGQSFLGASVSGLLTTRGQTTTADGDNKADFIIGAPGYAVTSTRTPLVGGAFIIEGAFLNPQTPINTAIQTQIGVGQPFAPFVVNATTPNALQIFVFSNNTITPPFNPVTDIDPTTVVVNGVPFPNATLVQDPVDENQDGIPDAIITITPRSRLNLSSSVTALTITGRTLQNSLSGGNAFSGTAAITVSGSNVTPVTPGQGILAGLPVGTIIPNFFLPHFGPDVFVPSPQALSKDNYKAIPLAVAYQQYLPTRGFAIRMRNFAHPKALAKIDYSRHHSLASSSNGNLPLTLDTHVFTRSKYHGNKVVKFKHPNPVIPTYRQTEKFTGARTKHPKTI